MFEHTPLFGCSHTLLDCCILPIAKLKKIADSLFDQSGFGWSMASATSDNRRSRSLSSSMLRGAGFAIGQPRTSREHTIPPMALNASYSSSTGASSA
jgi:hypothetical protein